MIHAIIDCIIDSHMPVVDAVIRELDALDEMVHEFGGEHRDLLKRAGMCRRRLAFLRLVHQQ